MHLFAYGSLMIPSVMDAVTGHRFDSCAATLPGYARFCLHKETYPGIIPKDGCSTDGVLYLNVDAQALARLDAFEGTFYERRSVEVVTPEGVQMLAEAYVVALPYRHHLTAEPWHLDDFRREHITTFLASYHGFSTLEAE